VAAPGETGAGGATVWALLRAVEGASRSIVADGASFCGSGTAGTARAVSAATPPCAGAGDGTGAGARTLAAAAGAGAGARGAASAALGGSTFSTAAGVGGGGGGATLGGSTLATTGGGGGGGGATTSIAPGKVIGCLPPVSWSL
jgi:hypothetical protein